MLVVSSIYSRLCLKCRVSENPFEAHILPTTIMKASGGSQRYADLKFWSINVCVDQKVQGKQSNNCKKVKIETQANLVDEFKVLTSIIKENMFFFYNYIYISSRAAWITICLVFPSPPKLRQPIWVAPGSHWLHSPATRATSLLPFIRKSFHWLSLENNTKTI